MILLDTNVISELAYAQAATAVVAWADEQRTEELYAAAITEAELLYGLALLPAGRRKDALTRAVETAFASLLAGRVLPFDRAAARAYADLAAAHRRIGRPGKMADLQIAAVAVAHGARLLATRDMAHFAGCGVPLVNPWEHG